MSKKRTSPVIRLYLDFADGFYNAWENTVRARKDRSPQRELAGALRRLLRQELIRQITFANKDILPNASRVLAALELYNSGIPLVVICVRLRITMADLHELLDAAGFEIAGEDIIAKPGPLPDDIIKAARYVRQS